ncbi:MAG: hypothetical protein K8T91_11500 [Planctomycetes bacterium]|nr:hypothetical protein [Planctomycetota bacterium]
MTQINLTTAKQLCTAAEFHVVLASNPPQVNQFSAADLKKHVVEARRLRDKWRDQANRQRRSVQQAKGGRVADDTTRSAEKAALFADVLARFEAAAPLAGKKPSAIKPIKARRSAEHRQTRAIVRESLSDATVALRLKSKKKLLDKKSSAPTAITAPTATAKKSGKKDGADKATVAVSSQKSSAAIKPTSIKKKTASKPSTPAPTPPGNQQKLGGNQLAAQTAAKKSRIQRSGLTTRIRGHVSARGRRAQGRRDSRS